MLPSQKIMFNAFATRIRRLLGRPDYRHKCSIGSGSRIYPTASIVNPSGEPASIRIGMNTLIRGELLLLGHGGRIGIGDYCYVGENSRLWSGCDISLGDRVLISHNVNIFDNDTHPISARARHEQYKQIITVGQPKYIDLREKAIAIEDDAWIGCMSIILKGVTVGQGAIVGAGSMVTKDIPPWTIAAGNPVRIIRDITEDERNDMTVFAGDEKKQDL